MEPWLKYNYYCSFRSVLHVYKMKKDVFEAYFIYTKWKTSLWSILHLYKVRKPVLETFFIVTDKKTFFRSELRIYKMKKSRFWSKLHLCKMTNTFWNRFTFRAMKKYVYEAFCLFRKETNLTFLKRFSFCKDGKHVFEAFCMFTKS